MCCDPEWDNTAAEDKQKIHHKMNESCAMAFAPTVCIKNSIPSLTEGD